MFTMTFLLCACALLLVSPASAYFSFQEQIPNGNNVNHPCKVNYRWPGVGHNNPMGGGARNLFGMDFKDIGNGQWTQALCQKDSDGDGWTNGEELGDPGCVWSPGKIPSRTTDITHPGICDPYGESICAGRDDFVDCEVETFEKCDILNEQDVQSIELRYPTTQVPATETNYFCMTFDLPSDQDYHLVAYEPLIDNRDVMHHIVMSGCKGESSPINEPQLCGMGGRNCFSIIGLWAVGGSGTCLGDSIAFPIGATSYKRVRLQFHYNNPKLVRNLTDSSGLKLYYRPARPEVKNIQTMVVGQRGFEIPPGQREVEVTGTCPGDCTIGLFKEPVYVVQAMNHMHYLGRRMKVEVFRQGRWLLDLTNEEVYNYDSPVATKHDPPVEILPGDEIRTTCVFNSLSSDRWVYFGDGTQDEMCYAFIFMYPTTAIRSEFCVSEGPVSTCDMFTERPVDGCDWARFIDFSRQDSKEIIMALQKNCNMDGFCRPECQRYLDDIEGHPCLSGDMGKFVKKSLARSHEGAKMLARLSSCSQATVTSKPTDCRDHCQDICPQQSPVAGNDAGSQHGVVALSMLLGATVLAQMIY